MKKKDKLVSRLFKITESQDKKLNKLSKKSRFSRSEIIRDLIDKI